MWNGGCAVNEIAVADTGPLLHLYEIRQIPLLATFQTLLITPQVEQELIRLDVYPHLMHERAIHLAVVAITTAEWAIQQKLFTTYRVQPTDIGVAALAAKRRLD